MIKAVIDYFSKKYSKDQKYLKQFGVLVKKINALEPEIKKLSDQELRGKTAFFKEKLREGASIDDLLVEAFAVVREASLRVLGMRHFDVQLIGGIVLHKGMVAEMKTGEGKTLVATLPLYLNALSEKGAHLVTVNDYLAQRDAQQMGKLYEFLGLSVGCIVQNLTDSQRKEAYQSDITYGTNNEFGFDYLRDNMKMSIAEMCQRPFHYAIVDEVDSILIDEARTPLIISGPAEESSKLYLQADQIVQKLNPEDYEKDEKSKNISFTDKGYAHVERLVKEAGLCYGEQLFQPANVMLVHHLNQALKARIMYIRDVDYIVKDGEVVIIDEFTGRMMKGRRYSDGLHQALEAKEKVDVEAENQTLASITFQNYFRMYPRLAGMTGTAKTEAAEFNAIYRLPIISVPTNLPVARIDENDELFVTFEHKKKAILKKVRECYERQQPVLVGTASIEKSELFSRALTKEGIPHNVLNARQHEQEAFIIAQAGVPGAVTIATNMAGRGTDIKLGGNLEAELSQRLKDVEDPAERERIEEELREKIAKAAEVARAAGGLYVVGTERSENRRIDNQLRGRSGRQGDPGGSKFYISLEDDLMRIFGPRIEMMKNILKKHDQEKDGPIADPWLTRSIEKAQQSIEAHHFNSRKHLLKYAEVLNSQRIAVYDLRNDLMRREDVRDHLLQMVDDFIAALVEKHADFKKLPEYWDWDDMSQAARRVLGVAFSFETFSEKESILPQDLEDFLKAAVMENLEGKEAVIQGEMMRHIEKAVIFRNLDEVWRHHLNAMEQLRDGIHLQAYGQKDPLNEYKGQAFIMFQSMVALWRENVLSILTHLDTSVYADPVRAQAEIDQLMDEGIDEDQLILGQGQSEDLDEEEAQATRELSEEEKAFVEALKNASEEDLEKLIASLKEQIEKEKQQGAEPGQEPVQPVNRNALCPCGSGLKYKACHGKF